VRRTHNSAGCNFVHVLAACLSVCRDGEYLPPQCKRIAELLLRTKPCGVIAFKQPCKLYVEDSGGNHVCQC
jgi:hypothetical protein